MKVVIAPDKFKGSLTSLEACTSIKRGLHNADDNIEIAFFPMADGGDGFAEVMKYYSGTVTRHVQSVDPLGRIINSSYELNKQDNTAFIELASCSGLAILIKEERNPLLTSTYGTGVQIKHAIHQGARKIILGIGGSATNDAGTGILSAMGFMFLDNNGTSLAPSGKALNKISKIIPPVILPDVHFEIACDVNNTLYGSEGAAFIFSGQKGATPDQVKLLDEGLKQFATVVKKQTGKNVSDIPGSGAAGGIAAGLMAFLPVKIVEGTQLILRASNIETQLEDTDLIITGEGKIDLQSFRGKTISAIASMAGQRKIPAVGYCGKLELTEPEWKELGLIFAVEISDGSLPEEESMRAANELLSKKVQSMVPLLKQICKR